MKFEKILNHTFSWVIKIDNYNGRSVGCNVVKSGLAWVSGLPKGLGEGRGDVKRGRGKGRRERAPVKASVSGVPLLSLPPFFAFLLPLFPQKRLILRLNLDIILTLYSLKVNSMLFHPSELNWDVCWNHYTTQPVFVTFSLFGEIVGPPEFWKGKDTHLRITHDDNFTVNDNRPFYRYGGHIELIRFKEYYRMPRGHEHILFVFSSALQDIFS